MFEIHCLKTYSIVAEAKRGGIIIIGSAWVAFLELLNLLRGGLLARVACDDADHLFGGRGLKDLVVGVVRSQDVHAAGGGLPNANDPAAGLLGGLSIGGDIQEDDVGTVLLEVNRGWTDPDAGDQHLNRVVRIVEEPHGVLSLLLLVLRPNTDHVEPQEEHQHLHEPGRRDLIGKAIGLARFGHGNRPSLVIVT